MFSNQTNNFETNGDMLSELTYLRRTLEEKDKINVALATALEKSKQIEASSKNLFDLKMQKIDILYKNFAKSLNTLFNLYPQIEEFDDLKKSFDKFAMAIESNLSPSAKSKKTIPSDSDSDTMRLLLNRVSTYSPQKFSALPKQKTAYIKRKDTPKTESVSKRTLQGSNEPVDGFESPAEKFLETGETQNNAYAKILNRGYENDLSPNESGFDLKEAVNPKDDLEHIMKSFNLD